MAGGGIGMSGTTVRLFIVSVLLMAGGMQASAQTAEPSESVTVTASKWREVFHKFEDAFVTPTPVGGKIARWERRICPVVVGQKPNFTRFVTQRVKYIALAAGARLNTEASCTPNIRIVFTTTPQALLDNVRKKEPVYLGYAETNAQLEKLATVTRPVQAWYTTETADFNGRRQVDSVLMAKFDGDLIFAPPTYASSGGRISDGITSGFNHILIVIDSTKLAGQKIVPLADYISMLALTQLGSLDACQRQQPSIVNMLATVCDHAQDGLTKFDLAYLQGLYKMIARRGLMFQRNDIASTMADTLEGEN
jgi:hypothetical protein